MMSKPALVGVVGAGYWGKNLVRVFHSLGSLGAICDTRPDVLEDLAHKYPCNRVTASLGELLADDSLQAVAIATPAETHAAHV